ncbi:MAG: AraC family transcriptional regulator [Rhodospirillales bacterium]|nr:AraC family transcriptional regulator [Rhodospirillales bacterium]
MIGCGTTTFTDPDDFRAGLPGPDFDLVLTGSERFKARLTWLRTAELCVMEIVERASRIAFLSLPPGSILVSFPLSGDPPMVWNGEALRPGQLVLHGASDEFHQRIAGAARWGMAWLSRSTLLTHGRALLGADLVLPTTAMVQAPSGGTARFRRLHAQACRLVQSKPDVASHPEVTRALKQDLVHALIDALAGNEPQDGDLKRWRHADVMSRFEQVLACRPDRSLSMADLCAAIGVPERTLRMRCSEFLGMSPLAYVRLRRLNLARRALLRTDAATTSVTGVARKFGFSELGRFATAYRATFGEAPSATLRGAASRAEGATGLGTVR